MLKGIRPAIVHKAQPVSIHGQISLDVHFADADDPGGTIHVARVGPEALGPGVEPLNPGDRVDLHYLVGAVTQVTRPARR
jgi:hypothetical protein